MSSVIIAGDTSGTVTLQAPALAGTTVLSLPNTSGTVLTTTGGVTPGTAGNVLTSNGTTWTSAALSASGRLINTQYFTSGSGTYTPTTGTTFVIVECVGGGGGSGNTTSVGGTSSFGALLTATGGSNSSGSTPGAGGSGTLGDLIVSGGTGQIAAFYVATGSYPIVLTGGYSFLGSIGRGGNGTGTVSNTIQVFSGGGGGYARKKITSGFSGVTVTVGAAGTSAQQGIVIVYEYA
jgi:hypothetical protein